MLRRAFSTFLVILGSKQLPEVISAILSGYVILTTYTNEQTSKCQHEKRGLNMGNSGPTGETACF